MSWSFKGCWHLNHHISIGKLKYYQLDNLLLKLMENYLSNRKQYVEIDGSKSDMLHLTTGVPYYVLCYLLSALIILPMHLKYLTSSSMQMTITCLILLKWSYKYYRLDCKWYNQYMVNNWLQLNKLSLNIKKSKYIIFHTKNKIVQCLTLKIDNIIIERVAELIFLG